MKKSSQTVIFQGSRFCLPGLLLAYFLLSPCTLFHSYQQGDWLEGKGQVQLGLNLGKAPATPRIHSAHIIFL